MSFIDKWRMEFWLKVLHFAVELKFHAFVGFNRALKSYQIMNGLRVTLNCDEIVDRETKKRVRRKRIIAGLDKDEQKTD